MDKLTLKRIETAHPIIRDRLFQAYERANNHALGKGVRLRFSHVYRSFEEQEGLYHKRPKVTNARGGQSIHNYGLAFDIVLLYDNNGDGIFEQASWDIKRDGDKDGVSDWFEVTQIFESFGFKNGFIRNGKKWDYPHFQMDFGYNWRELLKIVESGKVIKQIVNNKEYIYPIIND